MFKYLEKEKLNSLPKTIGIYAFKKGKSFLYIGKSINVRERVKDHFKENLFKSSLFTNKAGKIGYLKTETAIEALLKEAELIKKFKPKYNVIWKDNKNYSFVEITKEEFPRVSITHQKKKNAKYIGPFVDSMALKQTLKTLRRIFPFRTCKTLKKKPCLFFQLNLCSAPCLRKGNYNVKKLEQFLKGNKKKVVKELKKEMKTFSQNKEYEKAAKTRDKIFALENVLKNVHILKEREKTLEKLLNVKIKRIEGYDISNIQGKYSTGSMVVFTDREKDKSQYRKFRIRMEQRPNDTAMIREVLKRRMKHKEWPKPQLMLIDGGKAQLNAALKEVKDIKVMALAKRKNKLFFENKTILLKNLPKETSNLILRIRDEAHRFALKYHKKLREKKLYG